MNPLYIQDKQIEVLIFIWTMKPENKIFEIIAAEKDPTWQYIYEPTLSHVPLDNLPLYVNFPFKTLTFENLLKGEPITKPSKGLRDTRDILRRNEEIAYMAKIGARV
jgi:hypothetical protein